MVFNNRSDITIVIDTTADTLSVESTAKDNNSSIVIIVKDFLDFDLNKNVRF